jgi:hypothetical protein
LFSSASQKVDTSLHSERQNIAPIEQTRLATSADLTSQGASVQSEHFVEQRLCLLVDTSMRHPPLLLFLHKAVCTLSSKVPWHTKQYIAILYRLWNFKNILKF